MTKHVLIVLLAVCSAVTADLVQFDECDTPQPLKCNVHQVDISPCAEAASGDPCRIKKGRSASIVFDYTPEVATDEASSRAYWIGTVGTMPWVGMDTDACKFTTCPIQAGVRQTYNYTLNVSKKHSARVYKIQWRLWDEEESMNCCFSTKIRLV